MDKAVELRAEGHVLVAMVNIWTNTIQEILATKTSNEDGLTEYLTGLRNRFIGRPVSEWNEFCSATEHDKEVKFMVAGRTITVTAKNIRMEGWAPIISNPGLTPSQVMTLTEALYAGLHGQMEKRIKAALVANFAEELDKIFL